MAPSVESARNGTYQPLSRPLFYYVSKRSAEEKAHVRAFVEFAFTPAESGDLVGEVGYVPLPAERIAATRARWADRETVAPVPDAAPTADHQPEGVLA